MDKYFMSQMLVIIATIIISVTYIVKSKKKILIYFIFYNLFYGIHYLLLNAYTGFFMNMISIGRNVFFFYNDSKGKENGKIVLILLFSIIIGLGIASYQDFYSLISMSASLLSAYSIWQSDVRKYRYIAMIVSVLFIIYGIHIKSLFAVITEVFLLFVELIGIFINRKKAWLLKNFIIVIKKIYFMFIRITFILKAKEMILWIKI